MMRLRSLLALVLLGLAGCAVPVATGLDESDANRILLALDRAGVDAVKEADPGSEGRFRVTVARDDAARAMSTMRDEELPRPHAAGVLDAVDKGALVPSETAEHAQLVAGLAGDLERSLEGVDGVLSARVHLNVPSPDPLRDAPLPRASASVLLSHRGSTPPLTSDAVARLVAGGVSGLEPSAVAVVMVPRPMPVIAPESELSHVGPIAVARGSKALLQWVGAALLVLLVAFAAAAAYLLTRLRRAETAAASTKP